MNDQKFLSLAEHIAAWSRDKGRHVGAVIADAAMGIKAVGYNRFPKGVREDIPERHTRHDGAKYLWTIHAERAAICCAARDGNPLLGCTMYTSWFPCVECAKEIVEAGLTALVTFELTQEERSARVDIPMVEQIFIEAGVATRLIRKPVA